MRRVGTGQHSVALQAVLHCIFVETTQSSRHKRGCFGSPVVSPAFTHLSSLRLPVAVPTWTCDINFVGHTDDASYVCTCSRRLKRNR